MTALRVVMLLHKTVVHDSRVRREAATLAAAGHDVTVLELAPVAAGQQRLDGFTRRSVLPPPWVRRRLPPPVYRAGFALEFVRAAAALRPDVIHAHDAAMLLPGVLARRLSGARLVYDSHELATSVPYRERSWAAFVAAVERVGIPRAAAVVTVSDGIGLRLRERYGLATAPVIVRNVSALTRGDGPGGLRAAMGVDAAVPLVLHQGAPAPSRGCDTIVRAVARLPDVHLAFLGDPDDGYGTTLRAQIAELGVGDRVRLVPSVPLEHLLDHTAEADVGITLLQDTCENHRLALPNKLFEYIAAGVPVVGADMPEMRAVLDEYGVGAVADPDDDAALADVIARLLATRHDPARAERLAAAGAELSWDVERHRLLDLYAALAAEPPRRIGADAAGGR